MATIKDTLTAGFKTWYTEAASYAVGIIKDKWLVGPRPQRLGVIKGNLRNRIYDRVLPDGFEVGTNVGYGIAWEKGIPRHTVVAKKAKALMIPMGSTIGSGRWGKQMVKATGLRKVAGGKQRKYHGNLAIFRKKVTIQQQAPRPFLRPGLQEAMPNIMRMGEVSLGEAVTAAFIDRVVETK